MKNYYYSYSSMTTDDRIKLQETKGRFLCETSMTDMFNYTITSNPTYNFQETKITDWVDVICTYQPYTMNTTYRFGIEIKERNVDDDKFEKFPYAALKLSKLDRMLRYQQNQRLNKLFYVVFYQQQKKGIVFDINALDWDISENHTNRNGIYKSVIYGNKVTQLNDTSRTIDEPIFNIPFSCAYKKIDADSSYIKWENYINGRDK